MTDKAWYEYTPHIGIYQPTPGYVSAEGRTKEVFALERVHPTTAVRRINAKWLQTDDPGDILWEDEDDGFFQPICTCGWDGPIIQSKSIAIREARGHLWEHMENNT